MKTLIADIEADGLFPKVSRVWQLSIKEHGAGKPLSFNDNQRVGAAGSVADGVAYLREADRVVMHHGLIYDIPVLAHCGYTPPSWDRVVDTLVLSRLGKPEKPSHSLEAYGERFGLPKPIHEDWTKWSLAMEHRCHQDVLLTERVFDLLAPMLEQQPEAVAIEHAVAWEIGKMMRRGFPLDEEYVAEQVSRLLGEQEEILRRLRDIFPDILVPALPAKERREGRTLAVVNCNHPLRGQLDPGDPYNPVVVQQFNPASTQQVAHRLVTKYGWQPRSFTPTGQAEVSEETLSKLPYPEARVFVEYLKNGKNLGFMQGEPKKDGSGGGWLHHCRDGKVFASLNPCKAVTGRPSCSSPNLQQVPREKWLRRAFHAGAGRKLVGVDASGIELRMLAHYLAPIDGGAYAAEVVDGDIHSKIMDAVHEGVGWIYGEDRKGPRNGIKRIEYGMIYGAGNLRLGEIAEEEALAQGRLLKLSAQKARALGKKIRSIVEASIPGYKELDQAVKKRASSGKLRGLDGRTLWVRYQNAALNLLLQSAGIIVIKKAIQLMGPTLETKALVMDTHYWPLMWVHDEWQTAALPGLADLVGSSQAALFRSAGEALGVRCRLDGEYHVGDTWDQTH